MKLPDAAFFLVSDCFFGLAGACAAGTSSRHQDGSDRQDELARLIWLSISPCQPLHAVGVPISILPVAHVTTYGSCATHH